MAATKLIVMHIIKGKTYAQSLRTRTDYAINPYKTENVFMSESYLGSELNCAIAQNESKSIVSGLEIGY